MEPISPFKCLSIDCEVLCMMRREIRHGKASEPYAKIRISFRQRRKSLVRPPFAPYKGKVRKPGTGGIYELNDHLYEGRYLSTNAQGKREVYTVYAKTKEECEKLLEKMIIEVRERIKDEKRRAKVEASEQKAVPQ